MTLQRKDIITDDALMAPAVLSKQLEGLLATIDKIKSVVKDVNIQMGKAGKASDLNKGIEQLTQSEKEVIKVQDQLSSALAKTNDEYADYKRMLNDVNKAVNDKIKYGNINAQQATKENSSLTQLKLALDKNRQAYASLRTEQERQSKVGKSLLETIQKQDKGVKELSASMGKFVANTNNHGEALKVFDTATGGVVTRVKELSQQFVALVKSPIVLIILTLVAAFVALKSAVKAYYETTAEGEERMKQHQATWDAFFITLKKGWAEVGKAVDDAFGENGLKGLLAGILFQISPALAMMFISTEKKAQELAKTTHDLIVEHAQDVMDDAQTEKRANELIEISRSKLTKSAEDRLAAIKEYGRVKNEQAQGDVELAKKDLAAFDARVALEGRAGKMLEEEITKRAQLVAAVTKVESDAIATRTSMLKLEKSTVEEIHKERIEALQTVADASVMVAKDMVEKEIQLIRDQVVAGTMIKADGDKKILELTRANNAMIIQAEIDALTVMKDNKETNAEEDADLAKRIAELKIAYNKAVYDSVTTLDEATFQSGKSTAEKLQEVYSIALGSIGELINRVGDDRLAAIDAEMKALEESSALQIKLAGDNALAVEQIETDTEARRVALEKKKKQEQQRQARIDKTQAIFRATLNAFEAFTKGTATGGPILGALYKIAAMINVAAAVALPIPQFFKGTASSPEGLAWVGERGREIKVTPSGQVSLTPGKATLDYLEKGTQIIPHDKSMGLINSLAMNSINGEKLVDNQNYALYGEIDLLRKEVKRASDITVKTLYNTRQPDLVEQGSIMYKNFKKQDGSAKLIRAKNLSS